MRRKNKHLSGQIVKRFRHPPGEAESAGPAEKRKKKIKRGKIKSDGL